ncbi:MAG: hypothetical protein AAGG81_00215 [Chlamydiota bacterium]
MMQKMIYPLIAMLAIGATHQVLGFDIFVKTANGEVLTFDVDPNETIGHVIEQVDNYLDEKGTQFTPYYFDFHRDHENEELLCKAKHLRDYYKGPTKNNIEDMRYIVLTLGNQPLLKLKKFKSSLKSAGDRIDDVHPLHFWRVIFTNDQTVSAIHSMKRRKMVWKPFIKGMSDSLDEAAKRNNLRAEYIQDFANHIGIDASLFEDYLYKRDWEGFAKALLTHVPRPEGTDRYDQ